MAQHHYFVIIICARSVNGIMNKFVTFLSHNAVSNP